MNDTSTDTSLTPNTLSPNTLTRADINIPPTTDANTVPTIYEQTTQPATTTTGIPPPSELGNTINNVGNTIQSAKKTVVDALQNIAKPFISPKSFNKNNGKRVDANGFIYLTLKGTPEERGYSHGYLLADRIVKYFRAFSFFTWTEYGRDARFFMEMLNDFFKPIVQSEYKEFYDEMEGIAMGFLAAVKEKGELMKDEDNKPFFKDDKIILPEKSYCSYENSNSKEGYTDGKILIDINIDVIFLLNCMTSLDYLYAKLPVLIIKDEKLKKKDMYSDYIPSIDTNADKQSKSGGSDSTREEGVFSEKPPSFNELFFGKQGGGGGANNDKCSAFMAVGKLHTKTGEIICSHISFDNFITGQFYNVILYIDTSASSTSDKPSYNILMQTIPGGIYSSTDFFVTSAGFIGTETTIGGFNALEVRAPICVRTRKSMQYSKTLDDYLKYFKENNSGDYANTWYIGKTKKDENGDVEIMRIELGLKYINVERTTDGYFIGFNACYDARIRNIECINDGFYDIRRHSGARRVRLEQLIKKYKGEIDVNNAREIISDHYDVYTESEVKCSRTVCAHYELDKREYMSQEYRPKPYQPRGSVDAKVGSSTLCNEMKFVARWGNACGTPFNKNEFCDKHGQWDYQRPFLEDRPEQPWVVCSSITVENEKELDNAIKVYDGTEISKIEKIPTSTPAEAVQVVQSSPAPAPVAVSLPKESEKQVLTPSFSTSSQPSPQTPMPQPPTPSNQTTNDKNESLQQLQKQLLQQQLLQHRMGRQPAEEYDDDYDSYEHPRHKKHPQHPQHPQHPRSRKHRTRESDLNLDSEHFVNLDSNHVGGKNTNDKNQLKEFMNMVKQKNKKNNKPNNRNNNTKRNKKLHD
jgi:hypothetical protein